jgi:hypothetical protein
MNESREKNMMASAGTDPLFQTYDYVIGGKMVVGRAEMDESYTLLLQNGDSDAVKHIKEKLIHDMATYMLENNLVEFTHQDDPLTFRRRIAVRAYLAPSDQVKILRLANKVV